MSTDNSSVLLNLVMPGESAATLAPWTVLRKAWQYGEFLNPDL